MKQKKKICTDPKYLAWVSWSLLSNNPVSKSLYLLFCIIDFVLLMYYSFNITQRAHFSNFDFTKVNYKVGFNLTSNAEIFNLTSNVYELNSSYKQGGIQLSFLRKIDYQLNNLIRQNNEILLYTSCGILGFNLFILFVILGMAMSMKDHSGLEKQNLLKKGFTLILVCLQTFLSMILFDILIRTLVSANEPNISLVFQISSFIICALAIISLVIIMLYIVRIFNICVPTEQIPWSSPISKLVFLNIIIKAGIVACNSFDLEGKLAIYESIVFFFAQAFQASYRVLFAPNYVKEVDLFVKTKDFAICLIFFIGIICKGLGDQSNYDLIYFILFIPFVTVGWILFEDYRKQQILFKLKTKNLKMEVENEYALYVMMTLVRDCQLENVASQKVFGQLMDLMLVHIEDCDDQLCICDELENYYELLRLKQLHNQEVFPLIRSERKKYRKIIDDQGLIGTVSNITDLTLKQKTTESTLIQKDGGGIANGGGDAGEMNRRIDEQDVEEEKAGAKKDGKKSRRAQMVDKEKRKRQKTVYKINIDETKHRFLSELLYLFYFEMIQKFPQSFKIQLLANYFALLYKQKEMLCVFQMRSFIKQKLPKVDQCCHGINEQYLLWEISKVQKANMHQQQNQLEGNFNGDYFINMNKLYKEFNLSIEGLSSSVVSFWRLFERQQIDAEITYANGTLISKHIQDVFRIFMELDTLKIFKDYQMFFQFAIVQLHILNDPVAYELYIGKMKSILEINKLYQKNFTSSNNANSDLANFVIVDANGLKFGSIIQCNNNLRMMLGWSEEEVERYRIENFMPSLIREKHPEFMNRYNKTGQSYIINNKVTMFIKKANGYVIPVELYIKFHYSVDYQYTFLAIIRPFFEMAPFNNGVKYNINQLIFLIVENEEDGRISEFSESCLKLLGDYGFKAQLENDGIIKRIIDVVTDINFTQIRKTRNIRYTTNTMYEEIHRLDLNQFTDSNSLTYEYNKKKGSLLASLLANNGGIMSARTRIFEERYSGGVLDMNVFCFAFINENENRNGSVLGSSVNTHEASLFNASKLNVKKADAAQIQAELNFEKENEQLEENESQSATGSSSGSVGSSTASMAEFRNFHSFTEQQTPRTLTLIIRLIFTLYFIMITIAAVNLGINITRQMQSEKDVHTVRQAFDRMNWVSMNQLLVRVLLNIANGYEPENSILIKDRFEEYISLQGFRIDQLKNTQSILQQSQFTVSESFEKFITDKNVPLYYLSDQNKPYIQYESLNVAFNLYIAKLTEMNSYKKKDLVGNLSIQTLNTSNLNGYKPSYYEQSLFFIVQNGNKELRQFSIDASDFYAREAEQHAEQNIIQTKVTAIVSIAVIVAIGLIIAPILTQAEIRKYRALLYFLKIPKDKLQDLIKNCEYCLNMNDENRYIQIMKDYESFLGLKLVNQQVDQLRQEREELANIDKQSSRDGSSGYQTSGGLTSAGFDRNSTALSKGIKDSQGLALSIAPSIDGRIADDMDGSAMGSVSSVGESSVGTRSRKKKGYQGQQSNMQQVIEQDNEEDVIDHNNENEADNAMDKKDELVNTNKFNMEKLNLKGNRKHEKKHTQKELDDIKNAKTNEELEEENIEQQELNNKIKMINGQAYKRRSTMIFLSLSVILVLSTYFVIAYFLAMRTFQTAAEVIEELQSIFYKGSCFDSAMNFLRESQIRNESMIIKSARGSNDMISMGSFQQQSADLGADEYYATDYYLNFCFQKEDQYNQMRVNPPKFFENAMDYIKSIESSNMCEAIYTGNFSYIKPICKIALNGILSKGLTNAFYHMFTQILKANLKFQDLGETGLRNYKMLKGDLLDETMIQIIDMKAKILDPALNQLKIICMDSVITYISGLLNNFITAFIIFIAILTFCVSVLVMLGFRILRKSMWDTNIILKIIPFETLPKADRIEIKDFFKT